MQIKSILATSLLATASSALPNLQSKFAANGANSSSGLAPNAKFQIATIRSGSEIQYAGFQAALNYFWLNLSKQNATCDRPDENKATFVMNNGSLYLYAASATPQQLWVDRSGMGQGVVGYTTGAERPPSKAERRGWMIDNNMHLTFDGAGFIACPNATVDGAWGLWVSAGIANPGGSQGCLGIGARAVEVQNPNSCQYSQYDQH